MLKFARASIVAWPEASVTAVLPRGKIAPPFDAASDVNVTVAPDTRLSNLSFTVTRREFKAAPTSTVWGVPSVARIAAGIPEGACVRLGPNEMMPEPLVLTWDSAA